jgi:hypothetical protein
MSEFKQKLIDDVTNKKTGLTEQEEHFLDILFDKHRGNIRAAMDDSGYPKNTPTRKVTEKLKDHITEASKAFLSANTAKAVISVVGVLDDPMAPGQNTVLKAAKEVLDRTGVVKEEDQNKVIERNIFILPAKEVVELDD